MGNDKTGTIPLPRSLIIQLADLCKTEHVRTYAELVERLLASHKELHEMELRMAA